MATISPSDSRGFLGGLPRRLVNDGLVEEEKARELQQKAQKSGTPFVSLLVEGKLASPAAIAWAASMEFGTPLIDAGTIEIDPALVSSVSSKLIQKHHAIPLFKRGKKLFVGLSDPTNLQALDEIKFATGHTTEGILLEEDKLTQAIDAALNAAESASMDLGDEDLDNLEVSEESENESDDVSLSLIHI